MRCCLGLLTGLIVVTTATAQQSGHVDVPEGASDHIAVPVVEYTSKQKFPRGVTMAKLSNGMTVLVQENHAAPVATVRCFVMNTGSMYEGKWLGAGLSHLVEHLVAGGSTKKRSENEIQELVDSMGGQTNAYTSNDITAYHIDCPAKQVNLAIELISDSMHSCLIPEEEYFREMGVVQRELEMGEAERSRRGYQAMKSLVYTRHPMQHPIIGYLPVLQKITRQDVLDFYHDRYVPQNFVFVVVGDVKTDAILDEVLKNFKGVFRTTERVPVLEPEPPQASPRSTRIQMEGATAVLSIAWPTVQLQDPDLYPLDVASYVLSNGDSSRLLKRLRIDEPLAVSVSSSSYTPGNVPGWFSVSVECQPENVVRCQQIILEEINRLKTEPVAEAELAKVRRQMAAQHVFGQQTVEDQAESLGSSYRNTGDPLFDDHYVEGIKRVTADQVMAAATKYFVDDRRNTCLIEPIDASVTLADADQNLSAESPVVKKVLSNGLTVLVKRHAVQPLVTIQAFVRGGSVSDPDGKGGLASLASDLMVKGTEKYSAAQIAEHFDSIGGALSTGSQRNTSYLTAMVLKDDLADALDYTEQVLFHPTFPGDEFAKAKQLRLTAIAARKANPQSEIMDFWVNQLPKESPYSHPPSGTVESVQTITAADCKVYHQRHFVPNNMVMAVFGDIDPEATIAQLEKLFGGIPRDTSFSWPTYPTTSELPSDIKAHLQHQKDNTAMVMLAYPTSSIADQKSYAAVQMLDAVLTSGMNSRLFEELRGQRLVYYVFGMQLTGWAPGYFIFMSQTRPETMDEVVQRIQQNLDRIRQEGIPEDEFNKAREKLIASNAMQNTTASSQAFQAAINEIYGLGYDWDAGFDDRLKAVTIDEVVKLVRERFTHSVLATSSPEPAMTK